MKKSLFALAFAAACFGTAAAQTAPVSTPAPAAGAAPAGYAELLGATITAIMNTGDPAELRALAAKMERAATVAPADWLPRYYQSYALLINVFQSKDDADLKDQTLDQAEAALAQARRLHGDESELLALQAYIYQARLGVAPMSRMMKYPKLAAETAKQAQALNPANPRPYLILANNRYYTPAVFGGGPEAARPLYEEAKVKYAAFRPATPLAPNWGQDQLLGRLRQYEAPASTAQATN